jgi:hypothetical protein
VADTTVLNARRGHQTGTPPRHRQKPAGGYCRIKALDTAEIPAEWPDPRPLWHRFHTLRTVLALLVNAIAIV